MASATLDDVRALDRADPLRTFRARFRLPEGVIYLNGNSLGALPVAAVARARDVVEREWGEGLVSSWNDAAWIEAPARVGGKIAALIGAAADEVTVADSTSINLFKLIVAAARLAPERPTILTVAGDFPTDRHIAEGAAALLPGAALVAVADDAIVDAIDERTAVVVLSHVHYRSGARRDIAGVTAAARAKGARVVWDLSHSAGAIPLDVARDGVELAVGCGYKYLSGGPGAPSFLYAARALHHRLASPLPGWMGHAAPFAFEEGYRPAPGVARFLCGTPPILSLLALEAAVDVVLAAPLAAVAAKADALFDLFAARAAARCPSLTLITPTDPSRRGSHIAFEHPQAYPVTQALIARGVVGDFRTPDVLRFGLTPLYIGYEDVWRAVEALAEVLDSGAWRDERFAVGGVVT